MLSSLTMFGRYATGLPRFLRRTLTADQALSRIGDALAQRQQNFLRLMRDGIFENPRSPYRRLLQHASIEFGDIERSVRAVGIEDSLGKLYDAGVYVSADEFKGRCPICRSGIEIPVRSGDFENPFLARHYAAQTGGSSGKARRIIIDLDLLTQEAAYVQLFMTGFSLHGRPIASWRAVPPVSSGMKLALRLAKLGKSLDQWFSQNRFDYSPASLPFFIFTEYTVLVSHLMGRPIPNPKYVPRENTGRIVQWLAQRVREGRPAYCDTNASAAVRICLAAKEKQVELSGTFFRIGGEPYTAAKARAIAAVGATAGSHYSMSEIGNIGIACPGPHDDDEQSLDDVHILMDKIAVIQRRKPIGSFGQSVDALVYTTILPSCPTLMLNVESGDYGILQRRACGCPFHQLGMDLHLRQIRSYEKLTSEGVTFLGAELIRLIEEVLPLRFGGSPADYQLVEEEESGLPRVSILIDPRLGNLSDTDVLSTVQQSLSQCPGGRIMTDQWKQSRTLRVIRRQPYSTASAKVLPLHILHKS